MKMQIIPMSMLLKKKDELIKTMCSFLCKHWQVHFKQIVSGMTNFSILGSYNSAQAIIQDHNSLLDYCHHEPAFFSSLLFSSIKHIKTDIVTVITSSGPGIYSPHSQYISKYI